MSAAGESRRLVVEADGGSRGNPGVAGYGALVRDAESGEVLAERAAPLGKESNNVAEYTGLIEGLTAVADHEPAAFVTVRMDSKLVVEQMSGRWKIKHEDMKRLAEQARAAARRITDAGGAVTYEWIPRAQNKAADKLSNDGMDGVTVRRDTWNKPEETEPDSSRQARKDLGDTSVSADAEQLEPPRTEERREKARPQRSQRPTRIVLVRHGVTDFTSGGRLDGRDGADPDLNDVGRAQAEAAASAVQTLVGDSEVAVVTSSLARAKSTGAPLARALGVETDVDPDWDEQAFGEWDGLTFVQIEEGYPGALRKVRDDADYPAPGGESRRELDARVSAAFDRAVARGGTVIVVSHRIAIMSVMARILGLEVPAGWKLLAAPGSLTGLEAWPDGRSQVAFTNDTHHLR